ncbi:hypothetical protein [Mycolicibacterium mucogenicum]|uniref:Uncharacterized protein n=1 Tax=Mycolicibacterium mucogenicum DSM 44124 TaxID=1226753 RepID=A0A8E4W7K0_MYCMU|nr:hypothetical protein [Mycolicibacterium mucogenicum]QPG72694.1 hypothetical protein C1S78_017595 [Mycolicibacterium mucogenicum DSM 44124]
MIWLTSRSTLKPVSGNWLLNGKPVGRKTGVMRTNWLSKLAEKRARSRRDNRADVRDLDAARVRHELDAIRARFQDHR